MDLTRTEVGLLIALDALLAHEAVTPAARQLGISQPAMSAQLARLRRMFNDPLLTASGRKLVPTARALEIRQPLRAMLTDLDSLVRDGARFDPATTDRTFRLVGTDYIQTVLVPALFAVLAAQAPKARLALLPFDPPMVWPQLEADEVDLVLATGTAPSDAKRRAGLQEDFVAIQRQGHPRGGGPMTLDEFCGLDHALISPEGGGFVGATDKLLAKMGRTRRVACSVPSFLLAPMLISGSDLVALIPRRIAQLHRDLIDPFDLPFPSPSFSVDLLWHPRRQNDPAHVWFRTLVAETVADVQGRSRVPVRATISGARDRRGPRAGRNRRTARTPV